MSNPQPPTLAMLLELPQRLEISCYRCHRQPIVMSPEEAIAAFGSATTFIALRRALKCSACGALGRERMVDVRPSMSDYYAAQDRRKHAEYVAQYGEAEAARLEQSRRPPHAH